MLFQDGSEDNVSLSSSQVDVGNSASSGAPAGSTPGGKSPKRRKGSRKSRQSRREWEILEGLRDGQKCAEKPEKYQGFLMKRRKWPMKGWHKVSKMGGGGCRCIQCRKWGWGKGGGAGVGWWKAVSKMKADTK